MKWDHLIKSTMFSFICREFSMIGLLLIAFGTGGIKPCVAAFGGDQFQLPEQERPLQVIVPYNLSKLI
jgi:dipeptide/tripeptide permease